jgi:hypothetical protein
MKTIVWAAMQSHSVLEQVDRMLPALIDEDDLDRVPGRFRYRRGLKKSTRKGSTTTVGIALVTIGILMLIPGPVDLTFFAIGAAIGGFLGGPAGAAMGGAIGLAFYNIVALVVVIVGVVLIVAGLLGL